MISNHKCFLIATGLLSTAFAGQADAQRTADVRGFHIGAAANATSVKLDETTFSDDERENGYGLNVNGGYNFTRNFGVIFGFTGASIDDSQTEDYSIVHVDIGGRASFPGRSALVPYVQLLLSGVAGEYDATGGQVEFGGVGLGLGAGLNWFFSRRAALDVNFNFTTGEFDDVDINDRGVDTGDGLGFNTTRLNLGISIFP